MENLLQWSRTGQRPIPVSQKLQQFRATHGIQPTGTTGTSQTYQRTSPTRSTAAPVTVKPTKTRRRDLTFTPDWLPDLISLLLAAAGLAVAGYLIWLVLNSNIQQYFQTPSPSPQSLQPHLTVDKIS